MLNAGEHTMEYNLYTDNRKQVQKKKASGSKEQKLSSVLIENYLTTSDVTLKPNLGVLKSRSDAFIEPFIYSSPMDTVTGIEMTKKLIELGEYPVVCRFIPDWEEALEEFKENENVFFAVGTKRHKLQMLNDMYISGQPIGPMSISIDVAHGDSLVSHQAAAEAASLPFVKNVMSGTVCTAEGALRAIASGCTHIRVGVGPGSACTTRLMTGCGLPNLSAVYRIHRAISSNHNRQNYKIIADGGIKHPGDAVKYLAAGADAIMAGGIFSSCPETPGWLEDYTGPFKRYRGQASAQFQKDLLGKKPDCAEGAVGPEIRPGHSCEEVINKFRGGLRSAISYLGITSSKELVPENVTFIKITSAGFHEGTPHGT